MPDPLRLTILNAYVSKLQGITVAAGYRNTVDTVEILARGFDDQLAGKGKRPYIGVIPMRESATDEPGGRNVVEWSVDILAHVDVATRTPLGVATVCENITNDIRRALYADPQLGVSGVHMVKITGREGSEGSPDSVTEGVASVLFNTICKFSEQTTEV